MMESAIDWRAVVVEPWTLYPEMTVWVVAMGFFVTLACGLVGTFLVLRRLALLGDAISHSVLPGLVIAFLALASRGTGAMFVGAVTASIFTVVAIEWIHKSSRVKPDAAIGIVFSALFSVGVLLISLQADHVDLDADCVLYGEIAFVPLEQIVAPAGITLGPLPVVRMASVCLVLVLLILFFYKELLVTTFDPGLAASLGIPSGWFHYGLALVLGVVVVSAFESVGAILVIAMLIFPGVSGMMLSDRLPNILLLCPVFAACYSVGGYHLAVALNISIAGSMAVVAGAIFGLLWIVSPRRGLVRRLRRSEPPPVGDAPPIREWSR